MKRELLNLGFKEVSTDVLEWWQEPGHCAIALIGLGGGKFNLSVYSWKKEWHFFEGVTAERLLYIIKNYMEKYEKENPVKENTDTTT